MDKIAIRKFATNARISLLEDIKQKAYEIGIESTEKILDIEETMGGFRIKGRTSGPLFRKSQLKQRDQLISEVKIKGLEQVIEEIAYTWFNRFISIRFMEVNDYLPTGVNVLSSKNDGQVEPDIIKQALLIDLDLDKEMVYNLQDNHNDEELFKYLLVKQCNKLNEILPKIFEKIEDYSELLLPDNLLKDGSVIKNLVKEIEKEDFVNQVEIIGWMYQYYIADKKDQVFFELKENKKISRENIPAATQLFTPKWIVKYMVENSLGRLWLESHPEQNDLKENWEYYIENDEQRSEGKEGFNKTINYDLKIDEITFLDPAMGSGHVLVYAFDVFYDIYLKNGYSERDIPKMILEKNLFGLDIDDRAGQLAYFALMMKARSKGKRIFREMPSLNVISIQESRKIEAIAINSLIEYDEIPLENDFYKEDIKYLIDVFKNAKDYGSILNIRKINGIGINERIDAVINHEMPMLAMFLEPFKQLIVQAEIMAKKYNVVVTNPPYMGRNGMNAVLSEYTSIQYPKSCGDLFAIFIERAKKYCITNGYISMITMHTWMYLPIFEDLRGSIFYELTVVNLLHLGSRAFEEIKGEKVQTAAFTFKNKNCTFNKPMFVKLINYKRPELKESQFFNDKNRFVGISQNDVLNSPNFIPRYESSYTINELITSMDTIGTMVSVKRCLATGKDELFIRAWYEIEDNKFFRRDSHNKRKWFPVANGGKFRKWYGNNIDVLNWENDGQLIKTLHENKTINATLRNLDYFFKDSLTYTYTSMGSGQFNARYIGEGFASIGVGPVIVINSSKNIGLLGYVNSIVFSYFYNIMFGKTSTFETGKISKVPIPYKSIPEWLNEMSKVMINFYKEDWDSNEISWDFKKNVLVKSEKSATIMDELKSVNEYRIIRNSEIKATNKELNLKIINDVAKDNDDLIRRLTELLDDDILYCDKNALRDVKDLISYSVGCLFGRYSLDEDGLIFAGGKFDIHKYLKLIPTESNVLVITDDKYFEDDIANRFIEFLRITFGEENLYENLVFIAETLGMKENGIPKDVISDYFRKDFYVDHCKMYKNKPIYWQFDSGKQGGFRALIYMHRYDEHTVARVRSEYLHAQQKAYTTKLNILESIIDSDSSAKEKAKAQKDKDKVIKQKKECEEYDPIIANVANQKISIDLDDGVKVNYAKFLNIEISSINSKNANVLTPIKL